MKLINRYRDKINEMKRIFDTYGVKRLDINDEFYLELINTIEVDSISNKKQDITNQEVQLSYKDIHNVKMEIMVNIEGICNQMKGKTRLNRYSFGLDIRKVPLTVFLTEAKILIRNREFKKADIIAFYDDTTLRTGNRGFAITKDEIITNISGIFRVIRFNDMNIEPEFVLGLKKDAFRLHLEDSNYDIKVNKKVHNTSIVFDIIKLLFQYSIEVKKDD